ncbi:MAG: nucleotidyltransferase domain-containing protein [Legionellales bacterium]|jgi:predicted nucleotidyltransferase
MKTFTAKEQRVITSIIDQACQAIEPKSIYLFGSRARFNAYENSDYDFAFEFDAKQYEKWIRFVFEAEEKVPTLLPLDLVNMNEISPAFREKISQEGKLIFKRNK